MTHRLPAAVVLFLLVSTSIAPALARQDHDAPPEEAVDLDVMTFNIRYGTARDGENAWTRRRELVFNVIRDHTPDLVGVQEALKFQLDELLAALPDYRSIGVGRSDGETKGEYSAILYRNDHLEPVEHATFWLSDTPARPGSASWGNRIPRICTWARFREKDSGTFFYLYNTHFDHQSQPSRVGSAQLLRQRIESRAHDDPVIVTGDFNAAEDNEAIAIMKRGSTNDDADVGESPDEDGLKLVDSWRVIHPEAAESGTFNGWVGTSNRGKIDYVFVEAGRVVVEAEIIHDNSEGRYPSDHFPVSARVRLTPVTDDSQTEFPARDDVVAAESR